MRFHTSHMLGNDTIVLDPAEIGEDLGTDRIRLICRRNRGVGSDGILLGPLGKHTGGFALRIVDPDGGEVEKSGDGLRIFSRYLWDTGRVAAELQLVLQETNDDDGGA